MDRTAAPAPTRPHPPGHTGARRVALVTGATSGIGAATALELAWRGLRVVVLGRDVTRGTGVVDRIRASGGEAALVTTDLCDDDDLERAIDEATAVWGRLDHAFNNAGVTGPGTVADATTEDFDRAFAVNTRALWLCMRAEIRHMTRTGGGSIVNNLSVHSVRTVFHGVAPYAASKAAALALTRCAAVELAGRGIRVNGVAPGPIDTGLFPGAGLHPDGTDAWEPLLPMGRAGTTGEVADAVAWLFSDEARYVTGNVVAVDGGFLAC
ncbi:SDR family oxidoreductase [Cellulomonas sp. zg-ZUI222]|uniref:SDR family oxidoreductase n=1 Tax=Cellulomonas wangleii TaxID=2816956 RepID=A0ABX8D7T7_9CELL|nr:SDR family oxidoreductase [Cellulomonas wangleii]MBO0921587.1 SDR family oxidoreductase [Cellulomonas wangleii]MBO0925083.1 SDR family oxidoreductase [Cellulomonas wangleii]QVI63503.1 SDR family oxidoreductase [Cellulomonas wangleii]